MAKSGLPIGNLFVTLSADASNLIMGMAAAQKAVATSVAAIKKELASLDASVAKTMANVTKSVDKMAASLAAANAAMSAASGSAGIKGMSAAASAASGAVAASMGLIVRSAGTVAVASAGAAASTANMSRQMIVLATSTTTASAALLGYSKALTVTRTFTRGAGKDFIDVESYIVRSGVAYRQMGQIGAGAAQTLVTNTQALTGSLTKLPPVLGAAATAASGLSGVLIPLGIVMASIANTVVSAGLVSYAKFEHAMTNSLSIMGTVSDTMRKQMEITARDMSKNSTFTAVELARAYEYLATAGFDASQSIKALSVVNDFAVAGQINLEKATFTLSRSLHALGQSSNDPTENMMRLRRLSDLLVRANALSTASIEGLAEALENRASGAFRMYGVDIEEGIAMLTAFAKKGDEGARGGEHAYIVLRDLQRAFLDNEQAWKDAHLDVYANKQFRGPLALIQELEKAIGGLEDEDQKIFIKMLGFQDRSISALQSILGSSDLMRQVKENLKGMSNATQEVANKRLESFINQVRMAWHAVQDILITVGEAFLPAIRLFLGYAKDVVEWLAKWEKESGVVTAVVRTMGDTFAFVGAGLRAFFQIVSSNFNVFAAMGKALWALASTVLSEMASVLPTVIALLKQFADTVAKLLPDIVALVKSTSGLVDALVYASKGQFAAAANAARSAMNEVGPIVQKMAATVADGLGGAANIVAKHMATTQHSFWDKMTEASKGISESWTEFASKWSDAFSIAVKMVKRDTDGLVKSTKEATNELGKLATANTMGVMGDNKNVVDPAKRDQALLMIRSYKFREELDKLGVPKVDRFKSGLSAVEDRADAEIEIAKDMLKKIEEERKKAGKILEEDERRNVQAIEYYQERLKQLRSDKVTDKMNKAGIEQLNQFQSPYMGIISSDFDKNLSNAKEIADTERKLETLKKLGNDEVTLVNDVQMRKAQALEYYSKRAKLLQQEQAKLQLAAASSTFGSLAEMSEVFAGKQSGLYKSMFAASKAFAIAESIVKIQQGIAAAASLPFPANLPAIAAVAAATANIVSTIQAVRLEFAGEREKGGPVSANRMYLVGEKGPEPFIPSTGGTILPNDFLQNAGRANVSVVVNNYTDATATVTERKNGNEKIYEVLVRRVKDDLGSEIQDGRGGVARALERSYKLKRG